MRRLPVLLLSVLAPFATALAGEFDDDDDFIFDGGGTTAPTEPTERLEGPDDLGNAEEEEPVDFRDAEDGVDLLNGDAPKTATASGDSAELYRQRQAAYAKLAEDEEVGAWEAYLAEFPGSPYRERIQQRIEQLMDALYSARVSEESGPVDAMDREIELTQPILLENMDPRTRLRAGFELGLPSWLNPFLDYEYAFLRNLSAHVGLRRRYTGTAIEPGVKYAVVKSSRTNTLLTVLGDLKLNAGPTAFLALRPGLGFAKRIGERLDLQLQVSPEFELRQSVGTRVGGGFSGFYRASDTVGVFLESNVSVKSIGGDAGAGYFNVLTFGMKFFPAKKDGRIDDDVQIDMGASAPYSTNYYAFHYGSFLGQANVFFD